MTLPTARFDAHCCLDEAWTCRRCRYPLRGLPPSDDCPECGTTVGETIRQVLVLAPPGWVSTSMSGARLLVFAASASIVVDVLFICGTQVLGGRLPFVTLLAAHEIAFLFFGVVAMVGMWRLTTPEPGGPRRDRARQVARACAVALPGVSASSVALGPYGAWVAYALLAYTRGTGGLLSDPGGLMWIAWVRAVPVAVVMIGLIAGLDYFAGLALRADRRRIAWWLGLLLYCWIALLVLGGLLAAVGIGGVAIELGVLGHAFTLILVLTAIFGIVVGFATIVCLGTFAAALRRTVDEQRERAAMLDEP